MRYHLTEQELRRVIRESLVLERVFSGIPIDDFNSAVIDGAAKIASGADKNATEKEKKSAEAFMELHSAGGEGFIEFMTEIGEAWNNSPARFVIKIPGLAGAEGYEWSDFALDAFLMVAGGAIAGKAFKALGAAGSVGASAQRGLRAIYISASRQVGPGVMRKAVQGGLQAVAANPTDSAIKGIVNAVKDAVTEDVILEITPEQLEEVKKLAEKEGEKLIFDEEQLMALAAEANEKFGMDEVWYL